MQDTGKAAHSFLSANTPLGFVSRLEQLYNAKEGWKAYILKGGTGKSISHFIEKAGQTLQNLGYDAEYIHNVCDCSLFEGISVPTLKICIIDGTPPHIIDPKYPGAVESIINLGDCCDESKLAADCEKIMLFSARTSVCCDRVYRFLSAASSLIWDTYRIALDCTDTSKIDRYALRIAKREFTPRRRQGHETVRFISGITPDGVACFKETAEMFSKIFVIEDEYGIGRLLLNKLKAYALNSGYDITCCYCSISPSDKLEHLLIPSLSISFVTSNHFHRFEGKGYRHIHIKRFMDNAALHKRKQRISFNRKSSRELIEESVKLLNEAKANQDMLNDIYASSTDFGMIDAKSDSLTEKIAKL